MRLLLLYSSVHDQCFSLVVAVVLVVVVSVVVVVEGDGDGGCC